MRSSSRTSRLRLWADRQLFYPGRSNLDLARDGKGFVVLTLPEAAAGEKGSVHVVFLLNFFDQLRGGFRKQATDDQRFSMTTGSALVK
jgi:hypothetical protein